MARIHDQRPLTDTPLPEPADELSVRWDAGQTEARPAAPAQSHPVPAAASGDREPEPLSQESPTTPDPDSPGEGIVREEEPAEPNEPG